MTRNEAKEFVSSLLNLRVSATDEQAVRAPAVYPVWREDAQYDLNDRVLYNKILYKVIAAHTAQADWTPDVAVSLFAKVLIPDANIIPEWEQPDSTNPYMTGDKVIYSGKTYVSVIDNNIWSPDAYPAGWEEA